MKIYYQGEPGAYMNLASLEVQKNLSQDINELEGLNSFSEAWNNLDKGVLVLAIENSYAGSIHENLFNFIKYNAKIIGEYSFEINHCICSKEKDIKNIKEAYSHWQALSQCNSYLGKKDIKSIVHKDTAGAARMVSESNKNGLAAICSTLAAKMYGLNILEENIQDQKGNTTRFIVIVPKDSNIKYNKKLNKISILFEAKDVPASLYKCLGAFATNNVNLTKIESMPSYKNHFSYLFWIDFEGSLQDENVIKSIDELKFFTNSIKILGEY